MKNFHMRCSALDSALERTLCKIDIFPAFATLMSPIELIRKDFFALTAFGALADEGFQIFKVFISGTMLGGGHRNLLLHVC